MALARGGRSVEKVGGGGGGVVCGCGDLYKRSKKQSTKQQQ
jgi:hypothetical protein